MKVSFNKFQDLFFIVLDACTKLLIIITPQFFEYAVDDLVREDIEFFIDRPLFFKTIGRVPAGIGELLQMRCPAFMFFFEDIHVYIRFFCNRQCVVHGKTMSCSNGQSCKQQVDVS